MKKLVLLLAVVFSVSLFSCGNAEKAEANNDTVAVDSQVAPSDTVPSDTVPADSVK
ncbi:MAG: hypothetical protein ACI308_04805 [Muribaculaceae bacterium]